MKPQVSREVAGKALDQQRPIDERRGSVGSLTPSFSDGAREPNAARRCTGIFHHLRQEMIELYAPVIGRHLLAASAVALLWQPLSSWIAGRANAVSSTPMPTASIEALLGGIAILVTFISLAPVNRLFAEKIRRLLATADARITGMGSSLYGLAFGDRPAEIIDSLCSSLQSVLSLDVQQSTLKWIRIATAAPVITLTVVSCWNATIWVQSLNPATGSSLPPPLQLVLCGVMLLIMLIFSFPSKSTIKSLKAAPNDFDVLERRVMKSVADFVDSPAGLAMMYWELGKRTKVVLNQSGLRVDDWGNHMNGVVEHLRRHANNDAPSR